MEEKYYPLLDISNRLITPISYLRRLIKEEKLDGKFIGKKYIVSETALQKYLNSLGGKRKWQIIY